MSRNIMKTWVCVAIGLLITLGIFMSNHLISSNRTPVNAPASTTNTGVTNTINFMKTDLTNEELTESADLIIIGNVVKIKEKDKKILKGNGLDWELPYTIYTVKVIDTIKQHTLQNKIIDIFVPEINSSPTLVPGGDYLLTLYKNEVEFKEANKVIKCDSYSFLDFDRGNYILNRETNTLRSISLDKHFSSECFDFDSYINNIKGNE